MTSMYVHNGRAKRGILPSFHSIIKGRQSKSKVLKIANTQGVMCKDFGSIQSAFLDFYTELLGTSTATTKVNKTVVQSGPICTEDHHQILLSPVSDDEIKQVLFSIPSHKAPAPDGYSSAFFKDSWDNVGKDVCASIRDFFLEGKLLKQLHHTLISVIPKCDIQQNVTQFRPISCCNVVYKCISKLICNRLSTILPDIISDNQGGFIKWRSIVENILISQDVVKCYMRKTVSPRFMLKVDLKKAYDSVSWSFLEQMMVLLNFPKHLINLIMECVTTATYYLVVNGETFGHFKGAKGLSNGDVASIMILLRSFATLSYASGLQMNSTKTNAYFNGVPRDLKTDILQISGVIEGQLPFRYLEIPDRSVDYLKVPQVSWEKVCVPKTEGGMGIRDSLSWNIAAIGKLVWWIYSCPDRLWVKWVHQVYLKGTTWSNYTPSGDVSWGWKVISRVKDKLALGYSNNQWTLDTNGYSVSIGYDLVRLKFQDVHWPNYLWCSWSIPKHQFIGWLIAREALKLKDKLYALGISADATCLLCGLEDKSHSHLFLKCEYSRRILNDMAGLCHVVIPDSNLFLWIEGLHASSLQKKVIMCVILVTLYHIWMQRNKARVDASMLRPELLRDQIRKEVKCRLSTKIKPGVCTRDITWAILDAAAQGRFQKNIDDNKGWHLIVDMAIHVDEYGNPRGGRRVTGRDDESPAAVTEVLDAGCDKSESPTMGEHEQVHAMIEQEVICGRCGVEGRDPITCMAEVGRVLVYQQFKQGIPFSQFYEDLAIPSVSNPIDSMPQQDESSSKNI
ncbi:uncharacterized protein LOC141620390 [Silene latifolia]|uniref:uncharacterized protein LOC141620390 n=1 Tax=Silene latifolia TaxID=37657 RepID=UPI003D788D39